MSETKKSTAVKAQEQDPNETFDELNEALEETFPASDPLAMTQPGHRTDETPEKSAPPVAVSRMEHEDQ